MLRVANVMESLGVCRATVVKWITEGFPTTAGKVKLPATRIGRPYRIREADLEKFIEAIQSQPDWRDEAPKARLVNAAQERAKLDRILCG